MIPPYTPISSATELTDMWQALMGPDGFARLTLWVVFFDEHDHVQPAITPIDDLPPDADDEMMRSFASFLDRMLDELDAASAAFLISRPGPQAMSPTDRDWARRLTALPDDRFRRWPVHLATRGQVRVFAPDDLVGAT